MAYLAQKRLKGELSTLGSGPRVPTNGSKVELKDRDPRGVGKGAKVLMVASSYPRFPKDDASIFLRHLSVALDGSGLEVDVLAPMDPGVSDAVLDAGVTVHRFRYFPSCFRTLAYGSGILPNIKSHPWLILQVPFFLSSMFLSLLRLARSSRPSVIHAHWVIPAGLVAVMVGKLTGIPVVTSVHGGDAFAMGGRGLGQLKKRALELCSAWTSNTRSTAAAIDCEMNLRPEIIPMGVPVKMFSEHGPTALRPAPSRDHFVILFVGRLVRKKGVDVLINALRKLRTVDHRYRMWVIGDGQDRERLEQLCQRLGVSDLVKFLGRVPNDELREYYAAADLFVAPSVVDQWGDTEGQGVVLLEAMSAGIPVLASRVGGIVDVIEDGVNGMLFEAGNSSALAARIEQYATDGGGVALTENAFRFVRDNYDWKVIAERFRDLYQKVATL